MLVKVRCTKTRPCRLRRPPSSRSVITQIQRSNSPPSLSSKAVQKGAGDNAKFPWGPAWSMNWIAWEPCSPGPRCKVWLVSSSPVRWSSVGLQSVWWAPDIMGCLALGRSSVKRNPAADL